MKQWFRMAVAKDDPATADIFVLDIIGGWIDELWGREPGIVTAKAFVEELAKLPDSVKTIRLHVNSPGGDVFAAVTMANALRDQRTSKGRTVDVLIEGLAASAASIVIMAGDTIRISDNALVMIHNPYSIAVGTATDMRKWADELDTIRASIIATYRWHSELSEEDLGSLMDDETWMDADDALTYGFATEKVEGLRVAALLDPRAMARLKVPEQFRARVEAFLEPAPAPEPEPAPAAAAAAAEAAPTPAAPVDILRVCREGECLGLAEVLLAEGVTLEQAEARVAAERTRRTEAETRASAIRAACQLAKLPELADGYIAGAMPLADVKAHLVTLTAKLDKADIDGSLPPGQGVVAKAGLNASAIYAERNRKQKE
jgi:ATP-dependent protease ClpP protease subunit